MIKSFLEIRTLMSGLNEIADDDIVEILDGHPLDAFAKVLLLFLLQRQLNEQLLQFLVAEVYAELFKAKGKQNRLLILLLIFYTNRIAICVRKIHWKLIQ
jgi:hypothetical protein